MIGEIMVFLWMVMLPISLVLIVIDKIISYIRRINFIINGAKFDALIIGVAKQGVIIDTSGLEDDDTAFFAGSQVEVESNINGYFKSARGLPMRVEESGAARVKMIYTDPDTNENITVRMILGQHNYRDYRIFEICQTPLANSLRMSRARTVAHKYNQRLLSSYKKDVNSRNIIGAEKRYLIKQAIRTMNGRFKNPHQDREGYSVMNPPILVQGYYLNDDYLFIQRTNTPVLEDWTQGLP